MTHLPRIENESRRRFLRGAAGLTLAVYLPGATAAAGPGVPAGAAAPAAPIFEPNAFVRIGTDGVVTVISKHLEMGQGTYTGLATIVAEELDAAWSQVRVEGAPADAQRYNNLLFGQFQGTGGSTAIVVAHPPRFGARLKSFDAAKAKAVRGVAAVVPIPTGVAVLARDAWSAKRGRDALQVEWDESASFKLGSDEILARYRALARMPGAMVRKEGDIDAAFASPARVLRAAYDFPYLAHAAMEPMNCVVRLGRDECEIWNGEQFQSIDQPAVAALLGLKQEQVKIHMLYAGGSFGRRASKDADYVLEAVNIAKAIRGRSSVTPAVKLVWLREDDMKAGYYRPAFHHALEAALDAQGRLVGWRHRLAGQSILAGTAFGGMVKNGVDPVSVEGAANLPYEIPALHVDLHTPEDIAIPVHWWRSVGSTHTAYSTETFIDELADAAGQDPVAFRLALLRKQPRHAAVLKLAAEKAGWGRPLAPGGGVRRGRGVAVHESFGSCVAEVAEVTVKPDGSFSVDRVVCAVDCGRVINPDNVRSQVEGSVGFALSAVLHGAITLKEGIVEQSNFHDYPLVRIDEMPEVEVHIVPSADKPTGIGEPAVPPLAPAVANALAAATGRRARSLPIRPDDLKAR